MSKYFVIKNLEANGDSIITLSNGKSLCCTLDFDNNYIQKKLRTKNKRVTSLKGVVKVWNWTDDQIDIIPVKDIKEITPLGRILNNVRDN